MTLKIRIFSFSFLYSGLPEDESGNGGGFVFDCRFIFNPGRKEEFKFLTGKDKPVIEFLDSQEDMQVFLRNVFNITEKAVENYIERNFSDIMFSFGCTGGQHRSVYSAERLYSHLSEKFKNVNISIKHKEFL